MVKCVPRVSKVFVVHLIALFAALSATLPAQAGTTNCAGFQGWHTPGTPNTYGQFGSYVHVMSVYHTATDCDGYATKNAVTGTWQTYATSQTSDSRKTKYDLGPDASGNPRNVKSDADSSMLGTSASGQVKVQTDGTFKNATRTQDTLECTIPTAGSTELNYLGFRLCYEYNSSAAGEIVQYSAGDGMVSAYTKNLTTGGDLATWDVPGSGTLWHTNNQGYEEKCSTGFYTIKGTQARFTLNLSTETLGTAYKVTSTGPWSIEGTVSGNFEITASPAPSKPWICKSGSKVFAGADGPTKEEVDKQKESDSGSKDPCVKAEGGGRDHEPEFSDVSHGPETSGSQPVRNVGNPINFMQGFKVQKETDYTGPMGLTFVRSYRSDGEWLSYNFGTYWRHNFNRTLTFSGSSPDVAALTDENSVVTRFRQQTDGSWKPYDVDVTTKLESLFDSTPTLIGYAYTRNDNTREIYDTSGKLTRIEYLGTVALDLTYDGSGRLDEVTDESGRKLEFTYDGSSRIATMVTPDGTYTYTYGSNNNLIEVEKPDTKTREYHYENTSFVNVLTGITDERGIRIATWGYDANGLAISSESAGGVEEYTVTYNSDGTVTTENPLGKETIYRLEEINNVKKATKIDGVASTHCPASAKDYTYTAQGWTESKTDWEGNKTSYEYDSRGLETSRTEAVGESEERTITTTWDSTFRLPDVITRTGRTTDYDWDAYGRLTKITVTDTATSDTRIWNYAYWSNSTGSGGQTILGRLKEIDGPRTDVTDKITYAYDANYNLTSVTNALSQVTEITARDAAGRPTTIEGQNGVETDLTYDTNGRVLTVTVAPGTALEAVTTFTYDDAGDLTGMELPNGTNVTYTYDNARRLTGITDDLGNSVTYTRDNAGNVTQTEYEDSGSTLKYTHTRTFDELSRLLTSVGAGAAWSRAFAYDKNSNLTQYTDANTNATGFAFDPLQRLTSSTDALSGVTELAYNDLDQNTEVEDPRNNATTYTYNAFGDVTQMVSPDTGTTSFTVDKAGNVTQMTDARSVVTNFTYDAINRLATVAYPSDSSLNVTLTYDDNPTPGACGTSIGRLCRTVDAAGTTDYKYNALGQLIEVKEVRGALTFTTAYEYDLAGVLTQITLPSGREIDYTLNGNAQVSGVAADMNGSATTLASSITYLPFGPLTSLTYGNSKTLSATYDQDYRPTNRTVSGLFNHTYDTDADGNITQKGAWTYEYDALNRLDEQDDGSATASFTYDAIGNRLTEVTGSTVNYSYPSTNSKLSSVGADSYSYDAMGNITDDDALAYTWSAAALLKEVKTSGTSTVLGAYTYDASNLRTKKVAGGNTVHYVYGLGGLLYGEYDNSGALIREYVWLNGEPLAQVDAGSPEVLTYLHTDHLATPRYGTNAGGSTVWTWDSGAFGKEAATGSATVNLRFPGQYRDAETGLHYNWNRYYNPAIGRYVSSDSIGLAGGLNTFGYAGQSPLRFMDRRGLWFGFDDAVTGPVDEAIVIGGLLCLSAGGSVWATNVLQNWGIISQSEGSGGGSDGGSRSHSDKPWPSNAAPEDDKPNDPDPDDPKIILPPIVYDPRVRERGIDDPVAHNFPYSYDPEILATEPTITPEGYKIYQKEGYMNGKKGVFEIGVNQDGVVDHRFFRPDKNQ